MDSNTTAQWPQGIRVVKAVENSTSYANYNNPSIEKKPRPQKESALHCPRCSSTNTKFCYYNNYSLSQPRYFCKNCRRYWTEGGTLRNVPVGGGSRKNRRSSSSSLNSSKKSISFIDNTIAPPSNYKLQNPNKIREWRHDPEFAYNDQWNHGMSDQFSALPSFTVLEVNNTNHQKLVNLSSDTSHIPVMEFVKSGNIVSGRLSSSLLPLQVHNSNPSLYSSAGFPLHDQIKKSFDFSLDQNGYGNLLQLGFEDLAEAPRNVPLFPFEELKTASDSNNQFAQDRVFEGGHSNGFKSNGMLAHRSW